MSIRIVFTSWLGISIFSGALLASAEPVGNLRLPSGFRSELVYEVPADQQGSWVALAVDSRGRIIASDERGKLYRVEPSPLGAASSETRVEQIPIGIGCAQGLLCVEDRLYVMVNGNYGSFASGIYRLSDSTGDDMYDRIEQLRVFRGQGEHGPHSLALAPDGKSIYFCCGNMTGLPHFEQSRVTPSWGEDQLLPRLFDPRGHATAIKAPGGWIGRIDLEGENLELVCVGFRNPFDLAFNASGDLFTFDADMEWDIGMPWYRPTRICHAVSGADFGWRSGNGKWPPYFCDSLPPAVPLAQGSPTGLVFAGQTGFPAPYRDRLFAADWSYGRIFQVQLVPKGGSYTGTFEPFATGSPLAVTDLVARPQDGALYFAVGGRRSASGVYRIVWEGPPVLNASSSPSSVAQRDALAGETAQWSSLRQRLESFHVLGAEPAAIWEFLEHSDRFVRHAARTALERQPPAQWFPLAEEENASTAKLTALLAAVRTGSQDLAPRWSNAICTTHPVDLSISQQLDWVRTAALGLIRWQLDSATRKKITAAAEGIFPAEDEYLNRELSHLLVKLDAPGLTGQLLQRMRKATTQEQAIDAAVALSVYRGDWTIAQREQLLHWFQQAASLGGGQSSFGYLVATRDRFIAGFDSESRRALAQQISRPLADEPAQLESIDRKFVKQWKLQELIELVQRSSGPRDLQRGRDLFAAASCYQCHRKGLYGSTIGPDLTAVGGRFGASDLLRAIVEPNHQISDQYQQSIFHVGGKVLAGRITNLSRDKIHISTNMLDPKSVVTVRRNEIEEQSPSPVSLMPSGLLNTLNAEEILDLMAYLMMGPSAQAVR